MVCQLGVGGVGHIWSVCESGHEDKWRHSVAPIPEDKLAEITQATDDDQELLTKDGNALSHLEELKSNSDSDDVDNEDLRDDYSYFEKEVSDTSA